MLVIGPVFPGSHPHLFWVACAEPLLLLDGGHFADLNRLRSLWSAASHRTTGGKDSNLSLLLLGSPSNHETGWHKAACFKRKTPTISGANPLYQSRDLIAPAIARRVGLMASHFNPL